jgi:hypothetical protein
LVNNLIRPKPWRRGLAFFVFDTDVYRNASDKGGQEIYSISLKQFARIELILDE